MQHNQRFVWLDLVRGASALAVCAGHLRAATLLDYGGLAVQTPSRSLFYFLTGLGNQAVMVFFVLSGFFVGGSILKSGERFRLDDYFVARLTRLWIVLIPALVVTLAVDRVVAHYAPEVLQGAYYSVWNSGPASANAYSASVPTFLGNVFFLQTILTPVFGTNAPLWSLANEFWYYVLFPLFIIAAGRCGDSKKRLTRLASGVAAVVLLIYLPLGIRSGFLIWLMGVVVFLVSRRMEPKRRPLALVSTFGLFAGALLYSKVTAWQAALNLPADFVVGSAFAALCVVIATSPPPGSSSLGAAIEKLAAAVAEFSYSLYSFHFPFVVLIAALGYGSTKLLPNGEGLLHFFGWLSVLLALGALFWFLFERHTRFIRDRAASLLTGRKAA